MLVTNLTPSQSRFFVAPEKFSAFVAGFGSGKTRVGVLRLLDVAFKYPKIPQGYFAPNYPLVRDIFYPTVLEMCDAAGYKVKIRKDEKIVQIQGAAPIICRNMSVPEEIVGFEIGDAMIDEFDILTMDIAGKAWNKIIARMRKKYPDGRPNKVFVTTTPEGFKMTHQIFVEKAVNNPNYGVYHGSTYENRGNLPEGYIESLEEAYPPELIQAYLEGKFVSLNSGRVYPNFCRIANNTLVTATSRDVLHVGIDFNVYKGAASIHVRRDNCDYAVDEVKDTKDTDDTIRVLKQRYPNHHIVVYPDNSGVKMTSSNTTESDIQKLRNASFEVNMAGRNPPIKDRVAAVNGRILNGKQERRYFVNVARCPNITNTLERQCYDKNGLPDKKSGLDHMGDTVGYFLERLYPVVERRAGVVSTVGLH